MVDQPIDDAVVSIKPDFKGFRRALQEGVNRASRGVAVRLNVKLETAGVAAALRAWAQRQSTNVKVGVDLDPSGFRKSLQAAAKRASTGIGKIKVGVEADASHLKESVRLALAGFHPKVTVDIDTDALRRRIQTGLRGIQIDKGSSGGGGSFGRNFLSNIVDTGAPGIRPMTLLYAAVAALSPALVALASSASYASLSFAALGAGAIGAIGGITAVTLAIGSVTDYMKQYELVQKSQVQKAAQSTEQELQRASAIRSGMVQVGSARRAYAEAIRAEAAAEDAVHRAREQAKRDLEDLIELKSDLRREEAGARLDLEQSKADEAEVNRNFFATDLERKQAHQRTEDAKDALSDLQRDRKRNNEELRKGLEVGIDGSDGVKAALETQRNAAEQVVETRERIRDAEADLADAHKRAAIQAEGNTAAENELARQWARMSKPAQELATWLREHADLFLAYRQQMERAVLPGFLTFLKQITDRTRGKSVLDIMADGAATLGKVIGDTVANIGKAMNAPWFKELWKNLSAENGKAFKNFGDTIVILLKPIARLIAASAPLLTEFSKWLEDNAQTFADWIDSFSDADLVSFFKDAATELKKWWKIAKEIFKSVLGIFKAALPTGGNLTDRLGDFLKKIREWIEDEEGQKKLKDFFHTLETVNWILIAKGITAVGAAIAGLAVAGPWGALTFGGAAAISLFWEDIGKFGNDLGHWFSITLPDFFSERPGQGWAGLGHVVWDRFKEAIGVNAVKGAWEGIVSTSSWIEEKLKGFWKWLTQVCKDALGISSPSTVFASIGKDLIDGLWVGLIETWTSILPKVVSFIADTIGKPFRDGFKIIGDGAVRLFLAPFNALTTKMAAPVGKMLDWIDTNIIDKLNKVLTAIHITAKIPNIASTVGDAGAGVGNAINGIVGGIVKKTDGGIIDGYSPNSRADNIPAMLTAKEFVQPVSAVRKYGVGMMEEIRTGRYPTYADGGLVGKLTAALGGPNLITNLGAGAVKNMGGDTIAAIAAGITAAFGGGGNGDVSFFPDAGKGFPPWPRSPSAQRGNTGVWKKVVNLIHSSGIHQGSFGNGYRPGDPKWHGSGRAVDWMGFNMDELATWLTRQRPLELIHRTNRRDYAYTRGQNRGSFNPALMNAHRNHIHIAMARGGLVPSAYFDTGGKLAPGATLAINKTGQPETVRTAGQEKALMGREQPTRLDRRDLTLLAGYIATAVSGQYISMDGRKVAETVGSYGYLPGGM